MKKKVARRKFQQRIRPGYCLLNAKRWRWKTGRGRRNVASSVLSQSPVLFSFNAVTCTLFWQHSLTILSNNQKCLVVITCIVVLRWELVSLVHCKRGLEANFLLPSCPCLPTPTPTIVQAHLAYICAVFWPRVVGSGGGGSGMLCFCAEDITVFRLFPLAHPPTHPLRSSIYLGCASFCGPSEYMAPIFFFVFCLSQTLGFSLLKTPPTNKEVSLQPAFSKALALQVK